LGNNRLLPILNNGVLDERTDPSDPLTLVVKLPSELPSDIQIQSACWVSNISLTPYVVSGIFRSPIKSVVHKIGAPNFSIPIPNASITNANLSYTADDLRQDDEAKRELTISKNVSELAVDYTNFENFVVFSSAEVRLKIFKNKAIGISSLSSSMDVLNSRNSAFIAASGSYYPYYTHEYSKIQGQINDLVNSFDGYESYLYRSGHYAYSSGGFLSSSYVTEMDNSASYYDRNNRDSLLNNCPEHVLTNAENDDYIIFLTMVGHFFDNIYIYISNMPSERKVGNDATSEFTRRIVDYMLQTFGWNLDDSLESSNLLNNYLTSEQIPGLNTMSAEERLKAIRNRILVNLPQIYKTKGTAESVRLILACYGIPSALLSIREYGGVNYADDKASYTTYERVFMRQWDTSSAYDNYTLQCATGSHTLLFKFSVDDPESYTYGIDHTLIGNVHGATSSSIEGSGEWAAGFVRVPKKNTGKVWFRLGYINDRTCKLYSPEFPVFDGEIYSVMIRRNQPDDGYEYTANTDIVPSRYDLYVQRNSGGERIVRLTSSVVSYNTSSNTLFSGGGELKIGGWFTYWNQGGFTGCFDKLQVWTTTLSDSDFEDYVNNINSYAFSGSNPHESLVFRMHTDYPVDQRQVSSSIWTGVWQNANPFYATGSNARLLTLNGWGANVDYMTCQNPWVGTQTLVTNSCSPTGYVSASCYPFQFKVIDYPSTWPVSKYGPNKFRNEKIRYVSQSVEARFDSQGRSTYVPASSTAPDSNQVGFVVDPQDFKNRDIIRYLGNFDLMESIGDPRNQYSGSYTSLALLRKEYADAHTPLSGSKTLFNELCTLFKLYFNRSVFDSIRNVVPARSNALVGVLIEPTIIERPKYQNKPVFSEANTSSVLYMEVTASHYYKTPVPDNTLYGISASYPGQPTTSIDMTAYSLPTRNYPVNYNGWIVEDYPDPYMMGHFAGGILSNEELSSLLLAPIVGFAGTPTSGTASYTVQFTNLCFNTDAYLWDFGDGTTSTSPNPTHTYTTAGSYTVALTASYQGISNAKVSQSMVTVVAPNVIAEFSVDPLVGEAGGTAFVFTNLSSNALTYLWDFGDGETSTETDPFHTYSDPGLKTVTLTAYNGIYSDVETKTSYIDVTLPSEPCAEVVSGNRDFPSTRIVDLGTDTGTVNLGFNCFSGPDKIQVWWNGNKVIDTGYAGLRSAYWQSQLTTSLASYGLPPEPIIQYSATAGREGSGSLSFNKTSSTPTTATVYVYAPIASTSWTYILSCPQ
jgi:PKD repeat protein